MNIHRLEAEDGTRFMIDAPEARLSITVLPGRDIVLLSQLTPDSLTVKTPLSREQIDFLPIMLARAAVIIDNASGEPDQRRVEALGTREREEAMSVCLAALLVRLGGEITAPDAELMRYANNEVVLSYTPGVGVRMFLDPPFVPAPPASEDTHATTDSR